MKLEELKADGPLPASPASPSRQAGISPLLSLLYVVLGSLALVWVWHWNYNLLGNFYDYSILASSSGYLHHGLTPYRDFTTSLQSLPIYLSYGAELLFGPRYLSLAYANLVFGLLFYVATFLVLKDRLSFLQRVLVALTLSIATFFQHGILWYNSIAMMQLTMIVLLGANISRKENLTGASFAVLCLLLFLSSMTKLNFHLLGFAMTIVFLGGCFLRANLKERRRFAWRLPMVILSAFVLGPMVEIIVNGTTFHEFVQNVLLTPSGRLRDSLAELLNPGTYFYMAHNFYPDNYSASIYLTAALLYAICAFVASRRAINTNGHDSSRLRILAPLLLVSQFISGLLLTASNHEIQVLTASYLIVGLLAIYVMFQEGLSAAQSRGFQMAIAMLSGIFLITGSASSYKHSRLRFLDKSDGTAIITPRLSGYLQGVRFTQTASATLERIDQFMAKNNLATTPEKVYWGPGLEIMNRVYGTCPEGRLPLWYHHNVSVNDSDSSRIISALEKDHYEWVVASIYYKKEMPEGVHHYLHEHFDWVEKDSLDQDLLILHRKP